MAAVTRTLIIQRRARSGCHSSVAGECYFEWLYFRNSYPMRHWHVLSGQRFNICSHAIGLPMTAAWMYVLLSSGFAPGDLVSRLGVLVFAAAAGALYAASIACHSARGSSAINWQRVDHVATFSLIAGTLTAFALAEPRRLVVLIVLVAVWGLALTESVRHLLRTGNGAPPLGRYVLLGWLSLAAAVPVALDAGLAATACLLGGGLLYSMGTIFYRNPLGWKHAHGIWHLFVLAGTCSHYASIALVLRAG